MKPFNPKKVNPKMVAMIRKRQSQPSANNRIYCGKNQALPQGYHRKGSRNACLRKGIGVGIQVGLKRRLN